jgi:hypothetical protein
MRFRVTHTDRPSDSPPFPVRRWFEPRRKNRKGQLLRRVRWSEGYEDRLLSALARQIERDIATGAPGQRTSRPLADVLRDLGLDEDISRRDELLALRWAEASREIARKDKRLLDALEDAFLLGDLGARELRRTSGRAGRANLTDGAA